MVYTSLELNLERYERIELYVFRIGVEARRLHQLAHIPHKSRVGGIAAKQIQSPRKCSSLRFYL